MVKAHVAANLQSTRPKEAETVNTTTTLTKTIETASKCWCGAHFGKNRQCPRVGQHDALRLLQGVRQQCNCAVRHGLPKTCGKRRDKPLKSWCRCVCHGKDVRDVLVIEAEARSRPRCCLADGETDEQCVRQPSHKGECIGATGRTLGHLRHINAVNQGNAPSTAPTTNHQ